MEVWKWPTAWLAPAVHPDICRWTHQTHLSCATCSTAKQSSFLLVSAHPSPLRTGGARPWGFKQSTHGVGQLTPKVLPFWGGHHSMSSHPRRCGLGWHQQNSCWSTAVFHIGGKNGFFFFFFSNRQIALGKSSNSKHAHPSPTSLK